MSDETKEKILDNAVDAFDSDEEKSAEELYKEGAVKKIIFIADIQFFILILSKPDTNSNFPRIIYFRSSCFCHSCASSINTIVYYTLC